MKRSIVILIATIMTLVMSGCGKAIYPDLPNDAVGFEMGEYVDINDDDAKYGTIEYEGRIYMPYGVLGKSVDETDIDQCIGYIIMDENSTSITDLNDRNTRIFTFLVFLWEYFSRYGFEIK